MLPTRVTPLASPFPVKVVATAMALMFSFQDLGWSQDANTIRQAKTVSYTSTAYMPIKDKEGKYSFRISRSEFAFKAPGLYRDTRYDQQGNVRVIEIHDAVANKTLQLQMAAKQAVWVARPMNVYDPQESLVESLAQMVSDIPDQPIGQRTVDDLKVDVYRYPDFDGRSMDLWIVPTTGRLFGICRPGADELDPTEEDAAAKFVERSSRFGHTRSDIVIGGDLDDDLFLMEAPDGFEEIALKAAPTEQELVEWFRTLTVFNGGTFADGPGRYDTEQWMKARKKKKSERTKAEQDLIDLLKNRINFNTYGTLLYAFLDDAAVPGSFRYVGESVKLGTADKIVCWYQDKSTSQMRAIYGDLSVRVVAADELPSTAPTEQDLVEWLTVAARSNGDKFLDSRDSFRFSYRRLGGKPSTKRSAAENEFYKLIRKRMQNRNFPLMKQFASEHAKPESFHYTGQGVGLGDATRIVCWYQPKDSDKVRAIYGDLTIREVDRDGLPEESEP